METTVKIEGMMCMKCAARVQKALEALPQVTKAVVSHEKGSAVITSESSLSEEALKAAVENAGYTFCGLE